MEKVMPYQVVLELTDACNLKCIHCYAKSKEKGIFLSYLSIKNLIKELEELCTKKIILTGGEPFLHKDLKKIIKLIDKSGMVTSIRTNGILINQEMINFLAKIGNIDWIAVGVYWNDKEIKNKKSAFNKSLDSIHLLHENGIEVYASLTFMKSNFGTIPIMIDKIKKKWR